MNKPFCIAYRETRDKVVDVLNESGLPLDAMVAILEKLLGITSAQAEAEYQNELAKENKDDSK